MSYTLTHTHTHTHAHTHTHTHRSCGVFFFFVSVIYLIYILFLIREKTYIYIIENNKCIQECASSRRIPRLNTCITIKLYKYNVLHVHVKIHASSRPAAP